MWLKKPCFGHEPPVCAVSPCLLRRMLSSRRSVKQMSSRELKVLNLPLRAAELSATLKVEKCDSATNVRATSFEHAKQCAASYGNHGNTEVTSMQHIPLSQGQIALVDDDDFACVSQYHWCYRGERNSGQGYALRHDKDGKKFRTVYLHREIMGLVPPEHEVIFRNGDRL